ncbi:MAG: hypothetical protein JWP86_2478 [Phenylobacterium sp.]|nr:hypothetical protein [Phenylobacterium sp.]
MIWLLIFATWTALSLAVAAPAARLLSFRTRLQGDALAWALAGSAIG